LNKPLLGIVASASIGALLYAQDAPQPAATFRSEINYVQVPVRVLDARGEFVNGLTQSDFQIFEDGQAQAIAAFSAVDIPFVRHDAVKPEAPLAAVEAVASNEPLQVDGRVYVFMLDNQSMPAAVALRTRHVMRRFISDGFGANDVAAIVLTGTGRGQPFTRDRRLLNDAIDRLMSDADPSDNSVDRVMQAIADTARWMGAIKGRRKALVLITPSSICSLVNRDLNVFSNCNEAARYALRMAVQSDVSIYTIDPRGAVPTHGAPAEFAEGPGRFPAGIVRGPLDAARYLAEESGGFAVVNSNNLAEGFARVVRENSSYYLLGYYSTNTRADGKARRNEITVTRPDVRVVHRTSYLAPSAKTHLLVPPKPGEGGKVGTTPTASSLDEQVQQRPR
jgi:VWFA-related protein